MTARTAADIWRSETTVAVDVGMVAWWPGSAAPNDGWAALSGQTGLLQSDYPEFYALLASSAITAGTITTPDSGAQDGVFSLPDWNAAQIDGRGRVLEGLGSQTPGALLDDATAPNGLTIQGNAFDSTGAGGSIWPRFTDLTSTPRTRGVGGGDLQTRAPAIAGLYMIRLKPFPAAVSGNLTINEQPNTMAEGYYTFGSAGNTGFAWTQTYANSAAAGKIINNGAAGHTLRGGLFRVIYTAKKQLTSGQADVLAYVDGNGICWIRTDGATRMTGCWSDVLDARSGDRTVRFVRESSSGQGNTDAVLEIRQIA